MEQRIWISKAAAHSIENEAAKIWPLETGGVIVGYVADNNDMVILDASGPGPEAEHKRFSFKPDHEYHLTFLSEIFKQTSGVAYYLGDWHTHPNSSPEMSLKDRRTLIRIAKYEEVSTPDPLMLILGGGSDNMWKWRAHRYTYASWLGIRDVSTATPITFFNIAPE